jgi:hypothetical protein
MRRGAPTLINRGLRAHLHIGLDQSHGRLCEAEYDNRYRCHHRYICRGGAWVLSHAPEFSRFEPGPSGAFMGYDFHVVGDDPRLIEINTNAGGASIPPCCRLKKKQ